MLLPLREFVPQHDYLICFDSDGTVMDTMTVKHSQCLGPALIKEWRLENWEGPVLQLWYEINLYQITRGVNRFKALALALRAVNDAYTPINGLLEYEAWISSEAVLSGYSLKQLAADGHSDILSKALHWSETVNKKISTLSLESKKPFPGAAQGLEAASQFADIAVISTANRDALMEEWGEYALLDYANVILAQDSGGKAYCINELLRKGYAPDHVLMVGDAPGDLDAAKENGVCFYPMLCRHEEECWIKLRNEGYRKFTAAAYTAYEKDRLDAFFQNLNVR